MRRESGVRGALGASDHGPDPIRTVGLLRVQTLDGVVAPAERPEGGEGPEVTTWTQL